MRAPWRGRDRSTSGFDRRLVAPLVIGSVLNPVNSSMIAVALVPIGVAFGAPPSETVWLVSALYLATAVGQPVVGRLVDMYGPRRLYLIATALVGIAGLVGAFAPSLGVLIAARVLLGFGTCAAYPAAMSLIRSESERTGLASPAGVLTLLSIANQMTGVVGPTVGGLLVGAAGWRAIFSVNIPLSLACLVLGSLRLPRTPRRAPDDGATATPGLGSLDLPGMALFAGLLASLLVFLMDPRVDRTWLLLLTALAAVLLAVRELRAATPFLDLRLLGGNVPLLATYARQTLAYTTSYCFLYGFTQWLEDDRGLSASAAGLVLLPVFGFALITSALTGRNDVVLGKLVVGSLAMGLVSLLLLLVGARTPVVWLLGVGALAGIPNGLIGLANQNALYHQAEPERMGSSAGLLRTFMYLGAMVAGAAVALCFPHRATTHGLHLMALVTLACAVLLLASCVVDRSLRRPRDPHRADSGPGTPAGSDPTPGKVHE